MDRSPASRLLPRRLLFFVFFFAGNTLFTADADGDAKDFIEWSGGGLLKDGETLVSAGGRFELGFLSLGSSGRKFLCVWFRKGEEKPVVWVANRERPLVNTSASAGVLKFGGDGNLVVAAGGDAVVIWSSRLPSGTGGSRVAQLLDSGNLVVRDGSSSSPGEVLWQSFDEPGDTLLAGMKMVVNPRTNTSRRLTCWKSADDPSPGNVTYGLEINILPRLVLREGSRIIFTVGVWNGVRFTGFQSMNRNDMFNSSVVSSGDETYYSDRMIGDSMLLRVVVLSRGEVQRFVWKEETGTWTRLWTAPMKCERYGACGAYGTCMEDVFPPCQCLKGFVPRSPGDWSMGNGVGGCVRSSKLGCGGDLFLPVLGAKLPEMSNSSSLSPEMSLEECRRKCAEDCSCVAYAGADVNVGKGCITWSGDLVDVRNLSNNVQEFYLRLAASELAVTTTDDPQGKGSSRRKAAVIVAVVCVSSVVAALLLLSGFWVWNTVIFKYKHGEAKKLTGNKSMIEGEDMDIPLFDFRTITSATNNFSAHNRIGEGGFGTVYKAVLEGGQEVALKRLAWDSAQGVREFMNEVKLIVKLQHNNLVRLQGCCIQDHERILIFEYMHNGSLDTFIFGEAKRRTLDWRMRLDIILGIARGLLYLHHDSRLKIVHRDVKAGNILLDGAMNPKISDFGTAKIFSSDQHSESTIRVVGTYGYMAPEYALNGVISIKSDVFSFGVLVLEVLSGIRSRGIYEADQSGRNLLSFAWELWQAGNCSELFDPKVAGGPFPGAELLRCMQIGLLCVQESAGDRPTMRQVVKMMDSELVPSLPEPRRPGFLVLRSAVCTEVPSDCVSNRMTATSVLEGR